MKAKAGHHTSIILLFYSYCFEDELVGKPSALVPSALLSLYCLIIPFTHRHNNNNAHSSNKMIMHRRPQRDNMLHRIEMQTMALHVHSKGRAGAVSSCGFIRLLSYT